jgi:hypothetical protein
MRKPNVPLKPLITKLCRAIEKQEKVRILFAVENGSRAWRMESSNSDYDVRFVFYRKIKDYISLEKKKDVIERYFDKKGKPHPAEGCFIDIVGFDIFKYLKLLISSNPTAIEWLKSDIIYYGKQNQVFRNFTFKNFKKIALFYHYKSLCRQNYEKYIKSGNLVSYKKYLYAWRGLVNAKYVMQSGKVPPIDFTEALDKVNIPRKIKNKISDIIKLKMSGKEKEIVNRIPVFDNHIENFLKTECRAPAKADKKAVKILNKELQRILIG